MGTEHGDFQTRLQVRMMSAFRFSLFASRLSLFALTPSPLVIPKGRSVGRRGDRLSATEGPAFLWGIQTLMHSPHFCSH
jgi:hypothetical protein